MKRLSGWVVWMMKGENEEVIKESGEALGGLWKG